MSVRQVVGRLEKKLAHTTVMTTLDRLHKKGLLGRDRDGTAYVYRPAMSREEYHGKLVEQTVGVLLEQSAGSVLAAFVDTAADLDAENLELLEALIAERRERE